MAVKISDLTRINETHIKYKNICDSIASIRSEVGSVQIGIKKENGYGEIDDSPFRRIQVNISQFISFLEGQKKEIEEELRKLGVEL